MKTKPIPAIVMLIAGFVTCVIAIYTHMELNSFTKTLLLVLIVFYIFGVVIKVILDRNFKAMEEEPEAEEQEGEQDASPEQPEEKSEEGPEEEELKNGQEQEENVEV